MKLGVFDSGMGGLLLAKAIRKRLPDIDLMYFGDTENVPYGDRTTEEIHDLTLSAVDRMFKQDCKLIIVACNTASGAALRRLQQEYLPVHYPDRRILGVIVPTLETAIERGHKKFGLLATKYIAGSGIYEQELRKIDSSIELIPEAAPGLVPLIEKQDMEAIKPILEEHVGNLVQAGIDCLILGCTHYPYLKPQISALLPENIEILSQDEIIPEKLADYLERHPEINSVIKKQGKAEFYVSALEEGYNESASAVYEDTLILNKFTGTQ